MQSLPVLMYHYVSEYPSATSVTPQNFAIQCQGLSKKGWRGISLKEAEDYFLNQRNLPKKSVLITFDDGYLDNYVHAWPILQEYGHQAVIFAVSQRLTKDGAVRPTLPLESYPPVDFPFAKDKYGLQSRQDLFLSKAETKLMEASQVITIAAHSARHLGVIASAEPLNLNFHQPQARLNTFYDLDQAKPFGLPQFKERPALYSRAFRLYPEFITAITQLVPQDQLACAFFANQQAVQELIHLVQNFPRPLGEWESIAEQTDRIVQELQLCLDDLGPQTSFCWPWGKGSALAQKIAQELGFKVFFSTNLGPNLRGQTQVNRFKVRDKAWPWLQLRTQIYSHASLAKFYTAIRL